MEVASLLATIYFVINCVAAGIYLFTLSHCNLNIQGFQMISNPEITFMHEIVLRRKFKNRMQTKMSETCLRNGPILAAEGKDYL